MIGLSEILKIDFEKELLKKVNKNKHREYKIINEVNTRIKEYNENKIGKKRTILHKSKFFIII